MADKVWKAFERTVASFFGSTRNALSGGNSKITRSDSLHPDFFIECKYRSKDALYSLFKSTRERAVEESGSVTTKIPIICTKKKGSEGFLITIHSGDFDDVIERYLSVEKKEEASSMEA